MSILETAEKNKNGLIAKALEFAKIAHQDQLRLNGESYFNHCLETAETLNLWRMDEETIAAGLLHDTLKHKKATELELKEKFGEEVAFLVQGVTKLGLLKYRGTQTKIENIRKMILALSRDLRIVFIKLANRLHNLKSLDALPKEKQETIAFETNEIYAPLASLIGMPNLAGEMQDFCFPILNPDKYSWLIGNVKEKYEERHAYLEKFKPSLEKLLEENNLHPTLVDFRAKRYSSLYHKLLRYDMDLERIHDLIATWVVFKDVKDCYKALGVIHQKWSPISADRIKDYIAAPKPTGYRSLHTTVVGPENKNIEIQIHTERMHEENKNGLAAHWFYKQCPTKNLPPKSFLRKTIQELPLIKHLRRWQDPLSDIASTNQEFRETMKIDFFADRIFVITPKGDVVDLPNDSTPIDFAYKIHTEVGDTCVKAKVNNEFKPLNTKLKSADLVEIITQKNKKPSADWLKFAQTSLAKERIRFLINQKNYHLKNPPFVS